MEQVVSWVSEYGYWILFVGLFLEMLFLPFPGGTTMGFSGVLANQGELSYFVCILLAGVGSSLGMSMAYFIGLKLGAPFFDKYGTRFFMSPSRKRVIHAWFDRFGNKIIFISYFIPGIRHFTGYFSGILKLNRNVFLFYAIGGAFTWAATYVSLGYFFGEKWEEIISAIETYTIPVGIIGITIIIFYILFKWLRFRRKRLEKY